LRHLRGRRQGEILNKTANNVFDDLEDRVMEEEEVGQEEELADGVLKDSVGEVASKLRVCLAGLRLLQKRLRLLWWSDFSGGVESF
jgi:hypothetical protein